MDGSKSWAVARRQWVVTILAYSVALAPVGCVLEGSGIDIIGGGGGGSITTTTAGFFVNDNISQKLIAAARSTSQNEFFVYGDRAANGEIIQIDSIFVQQANGQQGFISFEEGRPVHMEAPDGSYIHVTYTTVTNTLFDATIELYDANSNATQQFNVVIDLNQTIEDVANAFEAITGETLPVENLTPNGTTSKLANQSSLATLAIAGVVGLLIGLSTQVLGQVLEGIYQSVTLVAQAALVSFFGPLIWISDIMANTVNRVQDAGISSAFDSTPEPPVIIVQ